MIGYSAGSSAQVNASLLHSQEENRTLFVSWRKLHAKRLHSARVLKKDTCSIPTSLRFVFVMHLALPFTPFGKLLCPSVRIAHSENAMLRAYLPHRANTSLVSEVDTRLHRDATLRSFLHSLSSHKSNRFLSLVRAVACSLLRSGYCFTSLCLFLPATPLGMPTQ
jgi:hypothetical protein